MAAYFRRGRALLRRTPVAPDPNTSSSPSVPEEISHDPSVRDVLKVKALLHDISSFPLELIDTILDFAEYWVRSTTTNAAKLRVQSAQWGGDRDSQFVLRSLPLGFVPGPDGESRGFGDLYNFTKPRPWQDPSQAPNDLSEEALGRLKSKLLTRGDHPCRKIVFTIKSHDQGWADDMSDRGTYQGTFTWFDAGLEKLIAIDGDSAGAPIPQFRLMDTDSGAPEDSGAANSVQNTTTYSLRTIIPRTVSYEDAETHQTKYRFEHPLLPDEMALQKNVKCAGVLTEHVITWSYKDCVEPGSAEANELDLQGRGSATGSGEIVRSLLVGDVVTVWAQARFPGWVNILDGVKIDIYWSV